jgi:hypothetical protein
MSPNYRKLEKIGKMNEKNQSMNFEDLKKLYFYTKSLVDIT